MRDNAALFPANGGDVKFCKVDAPGLLYGDARGGAAGLRRHAQFLPMSYCSMKGEKTGNVIIVSGGVMALSMGVVDVLTYVAYFVAIVVGIYLVFVIGYVVGHILGHFFAAPPPLIVSCVVCFVIGVAAALIRHFFM